jgi:two-component system, OmpR family, sensor histidine kinase KdpD
MGDRSRPDPDELLALVQAEEQRARRGTLKIFFGAAPGVGKTYGMLLAARDDASEGKDVVAGVIEHHGRKETAELLLGLEILPRRKVDYKGTVLEDFDLDAALARKPALLLVDELAHTNAEGSRHPKRWQDVEELLAAGIDVYTTMNVQHIESLNDVVAQITGVRVRETVPDSILDGADEVALIDLPPDDLIERLQEGKVYIPAQARHAIQNFFKKGNLIALRELALRRTAERVDDQMRTYKRAQGIEATWATTDRILVCVSPSPFSARLIRAARRMAGAVKAPLLAVYVETPGTRLSEPASAQLEANLKLAEALGAETVRVTGPRASEETLRFARSRNVTRIVVGKPTHPRWRDVLRGSFLDELVRASGDIDVAVITGDADEGRPAASRATASVRPREEPASEEDRMRARPYVLAAMVVGAFSLLARLAVPYLELADLVMLYLVGILVVSTRVGYGPSLFAAVLSVLAFDFLCVPPYLTFAVVDFNHIITFAVMLLVAFVLTTLTNRVRLQGVAASERERRTAAIYAFSRDLASSRDPMKLGASAVRHIEGVFQVRATVLLAELDGKLRALSEPHHDLDTKEMSVAQWVYDRRQTAGIGTHTLPSSKGLYLPLVASRGGVAVGVLGIEPVSGAAFTQEQRVLLETFANQSALAIERAILAKDAERAKLSAESEQIRNALLSSVSHDLRTPLAAIIGAASTLLEDSARFDAGERDLLATIHEEARRLNRLVTNLLEVTKLESGHLELKREWQPVEEALGAALNRLDEPLRDRKVKTDVPDDLPMVAMDGVLMEQVFMNLIENALKYTPRGTPIAIDVRHEGDAILVSITDAGPGIAPGEEERIFDKFYRVEKRNPKGGSGLGLTISRGIVKAHGGRIWAENAAGGGAVFRFTIPLVGTPPELPKEDEGFV